MSDRRRVGVWAAGVLGIAGAGGALAWFGLPAGPGSVPLQSAVTPSETKGVGALARGDAGALAELYKRVMVKPEGPAAGYSPEEATEAIGTLEGLRTGFEAFGPEGHASALAIAGKLLERFAVDPAPACWAGALAPSHAMLTRGLADPVPGVRASALAEVGKLWTWAPGRMLRVTEEKTLEAWKIGLLTPTIRRLTDRDPSARAAAVACLAKLPINDAAAPAVACLADPDPAVRQQVLIGFASRAMLLSEEAVLPRLYDSSPAVALIAERVLKARGLSAEQIGLGRMVFHPKAEMRASAIPLLLPRTDIDPVVWLLLLSHDPEESVRSKALEALSGREAPEVGRRLREMAQTDDSPKIRAAAAKVAPASETTASLPPLPGSPNLNPRAN